MCRRRLALLGDGCHESRAGSTSPQRRGPPREGVNDPQGTQPLLASPKDNVTAQGNAFVSTGRVKDDARGDERSLTTRTCFGWRINPGAAS